MGCSFIQATTTDADDYRLDFSGPHNSATRAYVLAIWLGAVRSPTFCNRVSQTDLVLRHTIPSPRPPIGAIFIVFFPSSLTWNLEIEWKLSQGPRWNGYLTSFMDPTVSGVIDGRCLQSRKPIYTLVVSRRYAVIGSRFGHTGE